MRYIIMVASPFKNENILTAQSSTDRNEIPSTLSAPHSYLRTTQHAKLFNSVVQSTQRFSSDFKTHGFGFGLCPEIYL